MLIHIVNKSPLLRGLIDFAYPPLCPGCQGFFDGDEGACPTCWERMPWYERPFYLEPPGIDNANACSFPLFAAGNYVDPLKQVVINFKFHSATGVVDSIARHIAVAFGKEIGALAPSMLVPIPLYPTREYYRGYNQAVVFAEALARELDVPVDHDLLLRVKKRRLQAGLRQSQRAINIRGVFAVAVERDPLETMSVILVDDVVTSGQTVFEARRTLMEAGFSVVGAVSMAHGL